MCLVQSVTQMLAYKMQKSTLAQNVKKLGAICAIRILKARGGFLIQSTVHADLRMDLVQVSVNISII